MAPKPTITELAKRVGVSVCTVNKALSGKPKVSEVTRQRIIEEAKRMGYRPNRMAQVLARNPIRLAYVHPAHFPSFYDPFKKGIDEAMTSLSEQRVSMEIHALDPTQWKSLLMSTLETLAKEKISGLILSPTMKMESIGYKAVWEFLSQHQIPLVQLGLELPGSPAVLTVRQDTFLSGQIAAELLSLFPGPVAMMIGKRQAMDHAEKLRGFQAEASRRDLAIAEVYEHQDNRELSYKMTRQLFRDHPEVSGLYVATDNISGILQGLEQEGQAGRIKVVATGVFPEIRDAMDRNLVHFSIDQRMIEQGKFVVRQLHELLSQHSISSNKVLFPPRIAVRRNIEHLVNYDESMTFDNTLDGNCNVLDVE